MKNTLTIQERLKDLRTEKHLTMEELEKATGIPRSTIGKMENDNTVSMEYPAYITLANFYGVSTDYIFGLTDIKDNKNDVLSSLHLDDETIKILQSDSLNSRLLCEIIKNVYFQRFMSDMEIYVDDLVGMQIKTLNAIVANAREQLQGTLDINDTEHYIETLKVAEIDPDDYFGNMIANDIKEISKDIRQNHIKDAETADKENPINELIDATNDLLKDIKSETSADKPSLPSRKSIDPYLRIWAQTMKLKLHELTDEELDFLGNILMKHSTISSPKKPGRGRKKR